MNVHVDYKYDIGDKVKIIKEPSIIKEIRDMCGIYDTYDMPPFTAREKTLPDKIYVIKNVGWTFNDYGLTKWYILKTEYGETFLHYHNRLLEEWLEPAGKCHEYTYDEELTDSFGESIGFNDKVYKDVYWLGPNGKPKIYDFFSFAAYGSIIGFHWDKKSMHGCCDVSIKNEKFHTFPNGKERSDGMRLGSIINTYSSSITKTLPDSLVEDICKTYNIKNNLRSEYYIHEVAELLEMSDENAKRCLEEKIAERKTSKKKKTKSPKKEEVGTKIDDLLARLSDDEIKLLKKKLNKKENGSD